MSRFLTRLSMEARHALWHLWMGPHHVRVWPHLLRHEIDVLTERIEDLERTAADRRDVGDLRSRMEEFS